jgi:hypothetical protein
VTITEREVKGSPKKPHKRWTTEECLQIKTLKEDLGVGWESLPVTVQIDYSQIAADYFPEYKGKVLNAIWHSSLKARCDTFSEQEVLTMKHSHSSFKN